MQQTRTSEVDFIVQSRYRYLTKDKEIPWKRQGKTATGRKRDVHCDERKQKLVVDHMKLYTVDLKIDR